MYMYYKYKQESNTCTILLYMFVRKVLFTLAPYSMCGSAARYCSFVNFMQVVPAWFSSAKQSQ